MTTAAFVTLGFLIGNLMGLSAESTLTTVLPLLLTFGGGSAVAFLHKLKPDERKRASAAVVALSVSCLAGAYAGILAAEYQILTPRSDAIGAARVTVEDRKYFRSVDVDDVTRIDQRFRNKEFDAERAYRELYQLVLNGE